MALRTEGVALRKILCNSCATPNRLPNYSLYQFLSSNSDKDVLDNLYNHPATCLAVFRELPPLAKQLIVRLMYIEQAIPQAVVSSWVNHLHQNLNKSAQDTLSSLRKRCLEILHSVIEEGCLVFN